MTPGRRRPRLGTGDASNGRQSKRTAAKGSARPGHYTYTDEEGRALFQVRRYLKSDGTKGFAQYRYAPDDPEADEDGYAPGLADTRRVLYRLPEVVAAVERGEEVWIAEGEKDVDRLVAEGVVATTNPMGAGKWRDEYSEPVRGAQVVLCSDRDRPGRQHALAVAESLLRLGVRAGLRRAKKGNDVSDHLDAGLPLEDLVRWRPRRPTGETPLPAPAKTFRRIPKGDRNSTLTSRAGSMRRAGFGREAIAAALLQENEERCDPPLPPEEVAAIAKSVAQYAAAEPDGLLTTVQSRMVPAKDGAGREDASLASMLTGTEVRALDPPEWLMDGYVPASGVSVIYGEPGVGKTLMLLALSECVSRGERWCNREVGRGAVLFYEGEGLGDLGPRLAAHDDHYPSEVEPAAVRYLGLGIDLTNPTDVAQVIRNARELEKEAGERVALIVFDPLIEHATGDLNDEGMELASRGLRAIAELASCAVIAGHHTNAAGGRPRGSDVLRARLHMLARADAIGDTAVGLVIEKQRNAQRRAIEFVKNPVGDSVVLIKIYDDPVDAYLRRRHDEQQSKNAASHGEASRARAQEGQSLILEYVSAHPGTSKSSATSACKGKGVGSPVLSAAIEALISEGTLRVEYGPNRIQHLYVAQSPAVTPGHPGSPGSGKSPAGAPPTGESTPPGGPTRTPARSARGRQRVRVKGEAGRG